MSHAGMIIGLPGLDVVRVKSKRRIDVWARPLRAQACCNHCGSPELRIKATHKRTVKHTRRGNQVMILHLKVPKYHCRSCGRYFRHTFPALVRVSPRDFPRSPNRRSQMAKPHLRAVTETDKPERRKHTVTSAIEEGDQLDALYASRRRIAKAIDDDRTSPRGLAALTKRFDDIDDKIRTLELQAKVDHADSGPAADEAFDSSAL